MGSNPNHFYTKRGERGYDSVALYRELDDDENLLILTYLINGQVIAVVEAKKVTLAPQNVLVQAQRYSRGVENFSFNFDGFCVPFIYSTNGEVFWFQDVRRPDSRSRKVSGFHTPNALREMLEKDAWACSRWFEDNPNSNPLNDAVEDAICAGKRKMMLAMTTGTGKTYTVVSQIFRLMESGLAKRILFLVDRRALAAQAVRAFSTFEAKPGLKFDQIYEETFAKPTHLQPPTNTTNH